MSEGQSTEGGDAIDRAIRATTIVWLGLVVGLATTVGLIVAMVAFAFDRPLLALPGAGWLFLLAAPVGLVASFLVSPRSPEREPEGAPDEGLPAAFRLYQSQFILRAGLLEGPGMVCAIGFLLTGEWAALAGALVMLAALIARRPSRAGYEAFLAARGAAGPDG